MMPISTERVQRLSHLALLLTALLFAGACLSTSPALAARRVMVKDKANIRSGPGLKNDVLWTAFKYYPLEVIGEQDQWLKVRDFEGDEGWVALSLVEEQQAVVVKVALANIRSSPAATSKVAFQAKKGVAFKVLGAQGDWLNVEHADGEKGWVHSSIVWGR
ncbi:MAG: SH3 domain-containing protein [Candidatus Tectomicrobia bacterium]|nr:SH3 domain-containing protein [Candidatus Tectomicrobia bacterium]